MINMAHVRRRCLCVLGIQLRNIKKIEKIGSKNVSNKEILGKKIKTFSTAFILNATFVEHIVTSNVIFHILFNEIFDVANIICMKIKWSILDVMHMLNYISLHVTVNIIKFKRMHGINYLLFGEKRLLFL